MALKIPPPWNPGYAIPAYVKAEGLQDRAFVTKWAQRGTYDDPDAFSPSWDHGYAVPQYIKNEAYGQGTFVTEWAPRGWYAGQVKKTAARIKKNQTALGDVSTPAPFAAYGRKSAAAILVKVRRLGVDDRKRVLKKVLDKIDPSLYGKTESYARQYQSAGVNAAQALELGLARAMSEGIGTEIVAIGKKGRRPSTKGQVGLGCYGRTQQRGLLGLLGLGEDVPVRAGFCWVKNADGSGYWVREPAGGCASLTPETTPSSETRTGGGGGVTVTDTASGEVVKTKVDVAPEVPVVPMIQVGPFLFPKEGTSASTRYHSIQLPADWQAEIKRVITPNGNVTYKRSQLDKFIAVDNPESLYKNSWVGAVTGQVVGDKPAWKPIAKAKHPVTGKDYGVFIALSYQDPNKNISDPTNPPVFHVYWKEVDKAWYEDIWNFIKEVVAKVVDVAGDILDTVGGIACELLQSQGAAAAGAAVAAGQGAPPQAGAQGVAIASASCGTTPPPSGVVEADDSWLLPVVIGGGVIAAAILLFPKKKRSSP